MHVYILSERESIRDCVVKCRACRLVPMSYHHTELFDVRTCVRCDSEWNTLLNADKHASKHVRCVPEYTCQSHESTYTYTCTNNTTAGRRIGRGAWLANLGVQIKTIESPVLPDFCSLTPAAHLTRTGVVTSHRNKIASERTPMYSWQNNHL